MTDKLLAYYYLVRKIIMNNASIYCNNEIKNFIKANSPKICYLPLYLPDLNLIEQKLNILKVWRKKISQAIKIFLGLVWSVFEVCNEEYLLQHLFSSALLSSWPSFRRQYTEVRKKAWSRKDLLSYRDKTRYTLNIIVHIVQKQQSSSSLAMSTAFSVYCLAFFEDLRLFLADNL